MRVDGETEAAIQPDSWCFATDVADIAVALDPEAGSIRASSAFSRCRASPQASAATATNSTISPGLVT